MIALILVCIGVIAFCVIYYFAYKHKQKRLAKIKNKNVIDQEHINTLVEKLKEQLTDIDFGEFGKFLKNDISIEDLIGELNWNGMDKSQQAQTAIKTIQKWKNLIESNSKYLTNLLMSYPLMGIELDEYWDDWCFSEEQKKLKEEELEVLRREREQQIQSELEKYSDKENPKDIVELYKKYLPYFNYNDFIKSIKLEFMCLGLDHFSIQFSDKNMDLFCAAYLSFDENLDDYDWHNF